MARSGPVAKLINNIVSAAGGRVRRPRLISPAVYEAVGLDRKEAVREARRNPHNHDTRRWLGEKIMAFLDEQGMVTRASRPDLPAGAPALAGRTTSCSVWGCFWP